VVTTQRWTSIALTCPCGSTPPQERSNAASKRSIAPRYGFKARKFDEA